MRPLWLMAGCALPQLLPFLFFDAMRLGCFKAFLRRPLPTRAHPSSPTKGLILRYCHSPIPHFCAFLIVRRKKWWGWKSEIKQWPAVRLQHAHINRSVPSSFSEFQVSAIPFVGWKLQFQITNKASHHVLMVWAVIFWCTAGLNWNTSLLNPHHLSPEKAHLRPGSLSQTIYRY